MVSENQDRIREVCVPELGASPMTVRICSCLCETGDDVLIGERMIELQVPGMTFDVSAPCSGRILEILGTVGTVVTAGTIIARIMEDDV